MMKAIKLQWIAVGSLLVGVFGGAAGAQIGQRALDAPSVDTGIFTLKADDRASFHVTLSDRAPAAAWVRLQFFDEDGASVAADDVLLRPGQSARLTTMGPRHVRASGALRDSALGLTSQPTLFGTVEVLNVTTAQRDPVCTLHDPRGVDGQRQ
jgi:hypothetical protein